LHMAQLMPLPLTVSCFSKIQIGFTFLVPAHPGSPGQRAVKQVCVCVCVCRMESWFWVRHFDIARSTSQPYSINLSERRMCCGKCCISLLIYFASVFSGRPYFSLTSCCGRINIVLVLVRNFILLWETETCNLNWLQLIGIFLLFFSCWWT